MKSSEDRGDNEKEGRMMRNREKIAMVAGALLLAWAGTVVACEDGERPRRGGFKRHDKDGDGVVSREEFPGPDESFDRLDTNGDGEIDKSEAPKGPPLGRDDGEEGSGQSDGSRFIDRLDTDGDGKVSKEEFDGPDRHFDRMDRDGDGHISRDEAPTGPPPRRRGRQGEEPQDEERSGRGGRR